MFFKESHMAHEIPHHIEAIIPNTEQPPRILVNAETGALPIIEHNEKYGTREGTLHELARRATGISLGVDQGLASNKPGTYRYRTKPVATDAPISPEYRWAETYR